ncbi:hypothetical protein OH687_20225 [Burkholderia anthina]|nr:hypothetical protein OH687_20225 [Burkholderia anthina]
MNPVAWGVKDRPVARPESNDARAWPLERYLMRPPPGQGPRGERT